MGRAGGEDSRICGASTTEFQAVHISTSPRSRQKKPLAMTPCRSAVTPVVSVAWLGHVTQGNECAIGAESPCLASAEGAASRRRRGGHNPGIDSSTAKRLVIVSAGRCALRELLLEEPALAIAPLAVLQVFEVDLEEFDNRGLGIDLALRQKIGPSQVHVVTVQIDAVLVGLGAGKQPAVGRNRARVRLVRLSVQREERDVLIGIAGRRQRFGKWQTARSLRR